MPNFNTILILIEVFEIDMWTGIQPTNYNIQIFSESILEWG